MQEIVDLILEVSLTNMFCFPVTECVLLLPTIVLLLPTGVLLCCVLQEDFDSEQMSALASCLSELFKDHFRGDVLPDEITEE